MLQTKCIHDHWNVENRFLWRSWVAIHSDFALFCWHEFRPRAISNRFQELLIAYLVIIVCYKVLKNLSWTALIEIICKKSCLWKFVISYDITNSPKTQIRRWYHSNLWLSIMLKIGLKFCWSPIWWWVPNKFGQPKLWLLQFLIFPSCLAFRHNKIPKNYKTNCNYSIKKVYKLFLVRYSYNKVEENYEPWKNDN